MPVLEPPTPRALRDELLELVRLDLLGPAGGESEIVDEARVSDRYLVGLLAPGGSTSAEPQDERFGGVDADAESGEAEDEPAQASLFPSSFGLSFRVDAATTALRVRAEWGAYAREKPEDKTVWQRRAAGGDVRIDLTARPASAAPDSAEPEVTVEARVRAVEGGARSVTIFLRNGQHKPERSSDAAWLFQVALTVTGAGGEACFLAREPAERDPDEERAQLALGYRERLEFAVGHGVAVDAEPVAGDPGRSAQLRTAALPVATVRVMAPPQAGDESDELRLLAAVELDMSALAEADDVSLAAALDPLALAYASWIERQRLRLASGVDGLAAHAEAGERSLDECERALGRLREGIALLARDADAATAFRFANRAMADQRVQSKYAEHRRRGGVEPLESFDEPENRRWRPFQLAFILLNLAPLADPHHVDRGAGAEATADLLWFPTGGGKTEAYLGLAAFALAIRRLQGELGGRRGDAGVTVLMRYTLRVLTLQQFQRAAALVCACEVQRREAPERYGAEPFRIGLWVGGRTTPNSIAAAVEAMRAELGEGWVAGGSPRQLTSCPWCGSEIRASDVKGEPYPGGRARTVTYCGDTLGRCAFSSAGSPGEGLPVQTVDEEIYRRPPSVLIATVDKFAQLPWKGETQTLFGIVSGRCERHGFRSPSLEDADSHRAQGANPAARTVDPERLLRPPDLIVQDELHLISGPLGSMVGLYETVIDELSTWQLDGRAVRPKVIASTATVRRARQQVHRLFLRDVSVFPPPGLDASDSFFARERALSDEAPGRAYLGVCASGRRLKAVLIRVYVAYLAAARLLYERHGPLADPWLTLVGYFNSMQELAGMRRLCDDDVRSRLLNADARGLGRRLLAEGSVLELTSRISAREIPKTLDRMGLAFPAFADHKPRRDGPPRCPLGDEHDLGRSRRLAARPDGRRRPAQDDERVHPGDEPRRPLGRCPGNRLHGLQLGPSARPLALRAVRALPRDVLPARRAAQRDAVRATCDRPRHRRPARRADPAARAASERGRSGRRAARRGFG